MNQFSARILGPMWMVIAGLAFSIVNIGLQYLGAKNWANSVTAVLLQYGIALIVFLPFVVQNQAYKTAWQSKFRWLHVTRVGISVVGIQLWTSALTNGVPIYQGIALLMTSPLFATVGSGLLLREKVSLPRWVATFVGFVGAMIILEPWSDAFRWISLLPVGAAFFWAGASLMTKFTVTRDEGGTINIVFYLLVIMFPFDLIAGASDFHLALDNGLVWVILGVIGAMTTLAMWAIAKSYALSDASYLQPFDHVKLLFNTFWGWLVFGYVPPGQLWIGVVLIIGAISYLTYFEKHENAVKVLWDEKHPENGDKSAS